MANTEWTKGQLERFSKADDFKVLPFYDDGKTYGTPTWIWSVVVDDQLFIRAWNGQQSRWYRSAVEQTAGQVFLAGHNYEVNFEALNDEVMNSKVDQAYKTKYTGSPYLVPMVQSGPRSTTIRVTAR
ncbi:DUF2255 family protein [Lactiplantibacillus paraplantarum]|uniref:DUF2255 family protein n=1 Tax=Lactiplantibacillus paraplantarum TaxID=60520 RepID=A0A4Q9XZ00_9LACO|nr:DUF2255 family protein [Lactiplantibacillus paraplantarum]